MPDHGNFPGEGQWLLTGLILVMAVFLSLGWWCIQGFTKIAWGICLFIGGSAIGFYYGQVKTISPPYMNDVVKVVQMQRHDFLNHLQIVSGLTQLGRADRVIEYIAATSEEVGIERSISKLLPVECGLILFCWERRLQDRGIEFVVELGADMSKTKWDACLANLIYELFHNLTGDGFTPTEILLRNFVGNSGIECHIIARGYDSLPLISSNRARELVRKMGGRMLVDRLDGKVSIRLLLSHTVAV